MVLSFSQPFFQRLQVPIHAGILFLELGLGIGQVLEAMRAKFAELEKTGVSLAWRLLAALKAGDDAGGDHRGKQSAAILVVSGRPSASN